MDDVFGFEDTVEALLVLREAIVAAETLRENRQRISYLPPEEREYLQRVVNKAPSAVRYLYAKED